MRVVLHHGIFGFDELRAGPLRLPQFPGLPEALAGAGHRVTLTRVHPCASISRRAEQLKASIEERVPPGDDRFLLIAHSLGGLDARHMLSKLGMAHRVAALLTVATPHRGASLAEFWHRTLNRGLPLYKLLQAAGVDIGAATDLTRESMARFNLEVTDHPAVPYFSVTTGCTRGAVRPRLRLSHRIVASAEGCNDGVVATSSSAWGEHLEHWEVDHVHSINRSPGGMGVRYVSIVNRIADILSRSTYTARA